MLLYMVLNNNVLSFVTLLFRCQMVSLLIKSQLIHVFEITCTAVLYISIWLNVFVELYILLDMNRITHFGTCRMRIKYTFGFLQVNFSFHMYWSA